MKENTEKTIERLFYSLKEASAKTGFSQGHLRNEAKRKKLRLVKSGRRIGILAEDFNQYLLNLSEFVSKEG